MISRRVTITTRIPPIPITVAGTHITPITAADTRLTTLTPRTTVAATPRTTRTTGVDILLRSSLLRMSISLRIIK